MKENSERLSRLFQGYYEKTLSPEETDELFQLLHEQGDDEKLNDLILLAWQQLQEDKPQYTTANSDSILNSILANIHNNRDDRSEAPTPAKLVTLKRVAAAAIVVLIAGAGYFIFRQTPGAAGTAATSPVAFQKDTQAHNNKAILRLANGSVIILDTLKSGAAARQGNMQISKEKDGQLLYKVEGNIAGAEATGINTLSTPNGSQYQVLLQDGTKVWLNAMSTLRFPVSFSDSARQVELEGEAYFEVATRRLGSGQKMPFHVKTGRQHIEVLGTHFNVMAYGDERILKTTLLEGSLRVSNNNAAVLLKPGEMAVLNGSEQLAVNRDADAGEETAWKDNLFNFRDAGIEEVMRQAARWYNIRVHYQGNIPQKEFNGKISRAVKLSEFLNILRYKGINVSMAGQDITIIN
jgi:ferric-dicitrate binding protein FerR (iron transport regulator)